MDTLSLESMLQGLADVETRQYQILGALKERREEFSHNRLFPSISDLLQLSEELHALVKSREGLAKLMPQHLKDVDFRKLRLVYEAASEDTPEFARMMELVKWALPLVEGALEEGREIYDFVERHVSIDEVGIIPAYREEGYWFVPDLKASMLHIFRYQVSIYSAPGERFRSLKTVPLGSLEEGAIRRSPELLKLEVTRRYRDLPNPAAYRCEVDIDFPFAETLLPVAKRKLMARLAA